MKSPSFRDVSLFDLHRPVKRVSPRTPVPSSRVLWQRGKFRFHLSGLLPLLALAVSTVLPIWAVLEARSWAQTPGYVSVVPHHDPSDLAAALMLGVGWGLAVALTHHEMAHAIVARRNGVPTEAVGFHASGAYVMFASEIPTSRVAFRIYAAGPLSNLAVGFCLLLLWAALGSDNMDAVPTFLFVVAAMELMVGTINLLPAPGLDGAELLAIFRSSRAAGDPITLRRTS